MANIKQQKKRILTDAAKRTANRAFKSQVKTALINADSAIKSGDKNAQTLVSQAQKLLDKTVSKRIKKANYVARKKSQLHKKLNAIKK